MTAIAVAALFATPAMLPQGGAPSPAPAAAAPRVDSPAGLATARNLGKAYYEQGDYPAASREFQAVVASGRALATDYFALGLCQMQSNKFDAALGSFTTAQQMNPKMLAAEYGLGILYKREMRFPEAERALAVVTEQDPSDPAAWFNLGTVYTAQQKYEPAVRAYGRVLNIGFERAQNFYVVSLFHTFNALVRLKRQDEAQKYLKLHQQYRDKVPGISVEPVALEGGKYGTIVVPKPSAEAAAEAPTSVRFADVTSAAGLPEKLAGETSSAAFVAGDYDGDGRPDLFITGARSQLWRQRHDGKFEDVTRQAGIEGSSCVAVFADYDNSGHVSLIVGGAGTLAVYHNTGTAFVDVTRKSGMAVPKTETVTTLVAFDADNDGLLDIFVGTDGGVHLFRNNGDGAFTDVTTASGLAAAHTPIRQAAIADLNSDNFMDLVLAPSGMPPLVYINQGGARFASQAPLGSVPASKVDVTDLDHDGSFDVLLWTANGPAVFLNRGDATFEQVPVPKTPSPAIGALADVDGDGFDDLLLQDANGKWQWLANRGGTFREQSIAVPTVSKAATITAANLGSGSLDLLIGTSDGGLRLWRSQSPATHWLEVSLQGQKSNMRGVGSQIEVKAGNYYQKVIATGDPARVFTGHMAKVDVVRVTWPNGIIQNVINVPTDRTVKVRESERVASSCPLVYGWDGTKWAFVTDALGASPLGELAPDGSLLTPNSQELVRLPGWIEPRNGRYAFQFTDEMREVDYFDSARLIAVDHAPGEQVYANEIYSASPTSPALYLVRNRHAVVSAVDGHGRDLRTVLAHRDGRYAGGFQRRRIPGLAETHALTLDLGSAAHAGRVALWLAGWVYWPDSNSAQALRAQKTQMIGPSVQVLDAQGRWVTVIDDMGLPSGTNRAMRVDLTGKFLSEDRRIRIVTNLCVYWDEIIFTTDEQPAVASAQVIAAGADLHYRGFATPASDPAGTRPDRIEYSRLDALAPWSPVSGRYTRYGDVGALVRAADDRMVVMGPGDELTVSFAAGELPPVAPGKQRQLFLLLDGWAKDNEPNTVTGNASGPLPYRAMKRYPYPASEPGQPVRTDYATQYQTRPARALIPPLAPLPGVVEK